MFAARNSRRWYQFSLRAMLVAMTGVALGLGWLAYNVSWIRERRQFIHSGSCTIGGGDAPGTLALFGEKGYREIYFCVDHRTPWPAESRTAAERLFPEARLEWINRDDPKAASELRDRFRPYGPLFLRQLEL